ncbi:MAG: pentapeptide repeat-containing protein [Chloroflexi bacterium]|nr:pentapeptide repeat-containing protein [Chloroflexota bacterium]
MSNIAKTIGGRLKSEILGRTVSVAKRLGLWLAARTSSVLTIVERRITVISVLILTALLILAIIFREWLQTGPQGDLESGSTTIRNLGLVIGGIVAAVLAVWRSRVAERQASAAHQQAVTAQRSLLNERYQRGAEMLGSDVLSVRLGGIYALDRLAAEQPDNYHIQVMQLFCAFARRPHHQHGDKPLDPQDLKSDYRLGKDQSGAPNLIPIAEYSRAIFPSLDIQAVMEAICSRDELRRNTELTANFKVDLSESDLSRLALVRIPPNLAHATMWAINLTGAHLPSANLQSAVLSNAALSGANLLRADLSGANLRNSDLSGTVLSTANLTGAVLIKADLSKAKVIGADFAGAVLKDSNLSGAEFSGMPLPQEALNVINNHLPAIAPGLSNVNLAATGLTQSQLDEARADLNNPPKISGVVDAETGKPLVWRGKAVHNQA